MKKIRALQFCPSPLLLLILLGSFIHSIDANEYIPQESFHISRNGYSLAYDARNRNPSWVYEHLTANSCDGDSKRDNFTFREDESIPKHLRATLKDYKGSGFDRGHLAPAGNHTSNDAEMSDTFFLSNICPQCAQFNRGYWASLEKYVRNLTKTWPHVYVVTGPLYIPQTESDGKRYIKFQVIGENDVAVPTHFFKVIFTKNASGNIESQAYVLPNQEIHQSTPLESFKTTVMKVEKLAGIIFTKNKEG